VSITHFEIKHAQGTPVSTCPFEFDLLSLVPPVELVHEDNSSYPRFSLLALDGQDHGGQLFVYHRTGRNRKLGNRIHFRLSSFRVRFHNDKSLFMVIVIQISPKYNLHKFNGRPALLGHLRDAPNRLDGIEMNIEIRLSAPDAQY
jgi:hypothetical protein